MRELGYLKDCVWKRLHNWNTKKLCRAGKEILLKTVAQALPNYIMSVLLLPRGVCHDIELMLNSFKWGGKLNGEHGIHWARWGRLCAPKAVVGWDSGGCLSLTLPFYLNKVGR